MSTAKSADAKSARNRAITEKQFQETVRELAIANGFLYYHTWDSRKSSPGFPDCVMLRGERCIIAELKTERGKTTEAQERWLAAWRQVPGAEVYVVRPSDRGQLEEVLR